MPALRRDWPNLALSASGDQLALSLAAEGLTIMLGQLIRNAAENGAGQVSLRAHRNTTSPMIDITDDGRGVSEGHAARIFEPFFSTRRESGGTGIGLTVVSNILQAHRAAITLTPSQSGTSFRITFGKSGF
jgi:two-component system, OmpR family, sensor kinase